MDLYAVRERRGGPWDWNRGLREQAGFDEHARFMDDLVESGFVVLGGPLEGDRDERWTILLDGRRWAENTF
jgi:hypothetical protein